MLHGILVSLSRVVREICLHMRFNKEVIRRWSTLLLLYIHFLYIRL
jgi:hypothetical protein